MIMTKSEKIRISNWFSYELLIYLRLELSKIGGTSIGHKILDDHILQINDEKSTVADVFENPSSLPITDKKMCEQLIDALSDSVINDWLFIINRRNMSELSRVIREFIKLAKDKTVTDIRICTLSLLYIRKGGKKYHVYLGEFLRETSSDEIVEYTMMVEHNISTGKKICNIREEVSL